MSGSPKVVLLGMMTKMPVAGVVWQTVHYLVGLRRLGFDVYYVEAHARTPSMLMSRHDDDSSRLAADFIGGVLRRFDLSDNWAFHALHADGAVYGRSRKQLFGLYREAAAIINLHGATRPLEEHAETGRLVYVETDPALLQVELHDGLQESLDFLEPHVAFFTFAENLGRRDCMLPVSERFSFHPTRQPVVTEFWTGVDDVSGSCFTTVGNWRQPWRTLDYGGERYTWTKDEEFAKYLDVPSRTGEPFELALASYEDEDRRMLESHGFRVRPALDFSTDLDAYRAYIQGSRGEFTVAKDQNVRLKTGWFSDRSATYLASGRPVITQDTGFDSVLPVGRGLFGFSAVEDIVEAVDRINAEPAAHRRAAHEIAQEYFDADVVLTRLLDEVGIDVPRRRTGTGVGLLPPDLKLLPSARRPLSLPASTVEIALSRPLPPEDSRTAEPPSTSVIIVTYGNLPLTRLCVESVLASTGPEVQVVMVDNASPDGTPDYLRGISVGRPRTRVVLNATNRGFARAVNQGLSAAEGGDVVLLNNDVIVPPGWLERLRDHLVDPTVGIVGASTNFAGNEAEIDVTYRTYAEMLDFAAKRAIEADGRRRDLTVATLFCAALRREVVDEIGPLDEGFELGMFEDDDYSMRARAAGYRVVLAEDAFVHHFGEAAFGSLVPSGAHAVTFRSNRQRLERKWQMSWQSHERRPADHYRALVGRVRTMLTRELPDAATVLVVSNGDDELLHLNGRTGWHFPQMPDGTYAGYHPGDSKEAIRHLEALRDKGAEYVFFPETALWWLDHYTELATYLDDLDGRDVRYKDAGALFPLRPASRAALDGHSHSPAHWSDDAD